MPTEVDYSDVLKALNIFTCFQLFNGDLDDGEDFSKLCEQVFEAMDEKTLPDFLRLELENNIKLATSQVIKQRKQVKSQLA